MAETIKIGGELESMATGNKVADASAIKDSAQNNKSQTEFNSEVTRHESDIHGDGGINDRLDAIEAAESITYGDENTGVTPNGSDFTNPDATKRAKVPTVGAILDGLNDGVYDVSRRNPTGGPNSDGKFTLEYILNNADTLIPTSWRHGGMLISFVDSSDNKYVQFFCTADEFTTDVTKWQGSDEIKREDSVFDFFIADNNGYDVVGFANGHIKTKNFDSSVDATPENRGIMSATDKTKLDTIEEGAEVNDTDIEEPLADYDYSVSDENWNNIVIFKDGHIKTKQFDSKNVEDRLTALEEVDYNNPSNYMGKDICTFAKIMCIGDSLTEGAFNYLSEGKFNNNTKASLLGRPYSYPQYLAKLTGCEVTNLGKSGFTSTQWYDYYNTGAGASTDFSGYDCAIIQLGVNDNAETLDTVTKTALDNIITKVKEANDGIKIFLAGIINAKSYRATPSNEPYYTKDQFLRNYYNTYYVNDEQVFFVDHVAYGHLRSLPNVQHGVSYPVDNYNEGHLSAYGYWRLAQDYVSMISYIMHNDQTGKFRKIQFIGTSYECY